MYNNGVVPGRTTPTSIPPKGPKESCGSAGLSWHQRHPEYLAEYYRENRAKKLARNAAWRKNNLARDKAHSRLRWLRKKQERLGELSAGEIEQMLELATRFPKLR